MQSLSSDSRHLYLQEQLRLRLNDIELDILTLIAKNASLKLSAFAIKEALFKKIESVEAFIIEHNVNHVEVVTVGSEGSLQHPFVTVKMMPFSEWAIVEGEE